MSLATHLIVAQALADGIHIVPDMRRKCGLERSQCYDGLKAIEKRGFLLTKRKAAGVYSSYHLTAPIERVRMALSTPVDGCSNETTGGWSFEELWASWPLPIARQQGNACVMERQS